MIIDLLIASLILGWMSLIGAEAHPMPQYTIELLACGVNADTSHSRLPHSCPSICQPVIHAQQECRRQAPCICSRVTPTTLDSCIRCAISGLPLNHLLRTGVLIPSRLNAYAEVCSLFVPHQDFAVPHTNLTTLPTNSDAAPASSISKLTRHIPRSLLAGNFGDIRCIFGLPEMVQGSRWPDISRVTDIGPWPVILFCAIVILCYAENRRSRSTTKIER